MALAAPDFDFLRALVRARSGIVLGVDKSYLIESRLTPVAKNNSCDSIGMLCLKLRGLPETSPLHRQVVEAMTTNETLFLRDAHPFESLVKNILPELMVRRQASKRLTIWCAACSTGQEPYSIAMLIRDQLSSLLGWQLRIVATDIATDILAKARAGIYSQLEISRGLPTPLLARFFTRSGDNWHLREEVKKMVEFRELNLLDSYGSIGVPDVVLMRNVLIYFDIDTKRQILAKVRRTMAPDGYFFLGGAETTMGIDDAFERIANDRGGCYRLRNNGTQAISLPVNR